MSITIEQTITKNEIPAVRRVDQVVEKKAELSKIVADALVGLSRAEIAVMRSALGGRTSMNGISGASYCDGYDPEDHRWIGGTRRLSEKALDKAIRSLLAKGLIRIEAAGPSRPNQFGSYSGVCYSEVSEHGPGNSGIYFDDEGEFTEYGDCCEITHTQAAAWYRFFYLGLTDRDPKWWVRYHQQEAVRVVAREEIARAYDALDEIGSLVFHARRLVEEREYLLDVEIAEAVKPDPHDMFNAVSYAFSNARREHGNDSKEIYSAMFDALTEFSAAAIYGDMPDEAMTLAQYEKSAEKTTAQIRKINDRIERIAR